MNPLKNFGRSFVMWASCLLIGTIAFFTYPNATGLPMFLGFLTAAGGFTSARSIFEDKAAKNVTP